MNYHFASQLNNFRIWSCTICKNNDTKKVCQSVRPNSPLAEQWRRLAAGSKIINCYYSRRRPKHNPSLTVDAYCHSLCRFLFLIHKHTHTNTKRVWIMLSNWPLMGTEELIMNSLCSGSRPGAGDLIRALTGASAIAALIWGVICLDNVWSERKTQRWQEMGTGR